MTMVRYKFAPAKARAAIHWMLRQQQNIDLHTLLKAVYFADKGHLNKFGRPIFGARYRAMKFGPVPVEIYEMAKSEPMWLAELGAEKFPWDLHGYHLVLTGNDDPDLSVLSQTDLDELKSGLERSASLNFNARTEATHGRDWQAAELGWMRYEDMLDETADKEDRISYLRDSAKTMRL